MQVIMMALRCGGTARLVQMHAFPNQNVYVLVNTIKLTVNVLNMDACLIWMHNEHIIKWTYNEYKNK